MNTPSTTPAVKPRSAGRALLWLGIAVSLLAPVSVIVVMQAAILRAPWHLPLLGTLGVLLILLSLVRRVTVWRVLAICLFGLFAVWEWHLMLSGSRLPEYAGPVTQGEPFPAFAIKRADGSAFTQGDLVGAQHTALVFFRGRW